MTNLEYTIAVPISAVPKNLQDLQWQKMLQQAKQGAYAKLEAAINEAWAQGLDFLRHAGDPSIEVDADTLRQQAIIVATIRGGPIPYRSWANRSPWIVYSCPEDPALRTVQAWIGSPDARSDFTAFVASLDGGETQPTPPPRGESPDAP